MHRRRRLPTEPTNTNPLLSRHHRGEPGREGEKDGAETADRRAVRLGGSVLQGVDWHGGRGVGVALATCAVFKNKRKAKLMGLTGVE